MFEIRLDDIRFHAFHGVKEQEKRVGGEFSVDVCVSLPLPSTGISDNLADTVSYADIYELVKQEMSKTANLVEHVADRICRALGDSFPQLTSAEVTITKMAPPIAGMSGRAGVKVKRNF